MPKVVTAFFSDDITAERFLKANTGTYFFVESVRSETIDRLIARKKVDGVKQMIGSSPV
jgi:hypothetical protein